MTRAAKAISINLQQCLSHTHTLHTHMQLWTLEIGSRRVNSRDGPPLSHTDAIANGSSACGSTRECRPSAPTPRYARLGLLAALKSSLAGQLKLLLSLSFSSVSLIRLATSAAAEVLAAAAAAAAPRRVWERRQRGRRARLRAVFPGDDLADPREVRGEAKSGSDTGKACARARTGRLSANWRNHFSLLQMNPERTRLDV